MGTYRNFWPIGGALIGLSGDAHLRGGGGGLIGGFTVTYSSQRAYPLILQVILLMTVFISEAMGTTDCLHFICSRLITKEMSSHLQ